MANRDAPYGLRPVRHLDGSPFNGQVERVYVPATDSTAIFVGDAVKSAGSADTDGVASVAQAAAGDAIRGVVVSVEYDPDNLNRTYRPASTEAYLYIASAPDIVFTIQEDAVGGALAVTAVGGNADLVVGTGDTVSGRSGMELDSSSATASAAQLRILGFVHDPENEVASANARVEVMINEHELKSTTGV